MPPFDINAIDPAKLTQLAQNADPAPILATFGSVNPAQMMGTQGMPTGAFGSVNPAAMNFAPGPGGGLQVPDQKPASPLSLQQMQLLRGMMAPPDQRFPSAGVGARPGQVQMHAVAPPAAATPRRPTLAELIGR